MQKKKKGKWGKPKLIVLVRGRPEERILAVCKVGVYDGCHIAGTDVETLAAS